MPQAAVSADGRPRDTRIRWPAPARSSAPPWWRRVWRDPIMIIANLNNLACDDLRPIRFSVSAGTTVYIQVGGGSGAYG